MLRVRCDPARPLAFLGAGHGRQRRNTADVFGGTAGQTLAAVVLAERDRRLSLVLASGAAWHLYLFGPRPNVLLADAAGRVAEAFRQPAAWAGREAPPPRPAPDPRTPAAFAARREAAARRPTLAQAAAALAPLLPRLLAADAVRRASLAPEAPPRALGEAAWDALYAALATLRDALETPAPHVYRVADAPARAPLALVPAPLAHPPEGWLAESFPSADEAARVFARASLRGRAFEARFRPLERALAALHERRARSAEAMLAELARPSRASRYEAFGHLLMAQAAGQGPGHEAVTLPDVLTGGPPVAVPLDPARSAVENAARYYARARQARRARQAAEGRREALAAEAEAAARLLARLRACKSAAEVDALRAEALAALPALGRAEAQTNAPSEPFRRVALPGGFEALVGKHARGNAALVTRHARPHDLWLHARGVSGAHVIVPRASRTAAVPRVVVEAAAALAAYHSDARTQALAPVSVTERKYVRPVKGGPPGAVRIEREDVLLVAPARP